MCGLQATAGAYIHDTGWEKMSKMSWEIDLCKQARVLYMKYWRFTLPQNWDSSSLTVAPSHNKTYHEKSPRSWVGITTCVNSENSTRDFQVVARSGRVIVMATSSKVYQGSKGEHVNKSKPFCLVKFTDSSEGPIIHQLEYINRPIVY